MFRAIDPTDGSLVTEHPFDGRDVAVRRALAAVEAQDRWRAVGLADRAERLRALAEVIRGRKDDLAALMTREMGKPIAQAEAEVDKCALVAEHYATHGESFLAPIPDESFQGEGARAYVTHQPLGVVLAIMPWNFPLWQLFRFGAPAVMAGNGIVLKHAPNVPGCAEAIEDLFRAAGFPEDLVVQVRADLETTGALIDHEAIAAVTLTGSTQAGAAVAERAGGALKKCVLELGGSDPYLLLPDADIPKAAAIFVKSRTINNGQSCIAAKRLIVPRDRLADVEGAVVAEMEGVRRGDPRSRETGLGPMAREDLRDGLHEQVCRSVDAGARLLLGGQVPDEAGWWYPPTVLTDVAPGAAAYDEELFGPVATIVPADDVDDMIRIANDTAYGLGGGVFTADPAAGEDIARDRLVAGSVVVNDFVRSDPRLPFGGVKRSGYGRELGPQGILEFVNVKTVLVRAQG